jgi:PrtD family type I secretion system ABC transporter
MAVFRKGRSDLLSETVQACRRAVRPLFVFSAAINLLTLTTSLYMMQLFDRVIVSRNWDTLVFLTLIAAVALVALAALDAVRARILARVSTYIQHVLGPDAIERGIAASLRGHPYRGEALHDIDHLRALIGGPAMLALFDAPWIPLYIGVIAVMNPLLGEIALIGGLALFGLAFLNERYTRKPLKESSQKAMTARQLVDTAYRNAEVVDAMGLGGRLIARWTGDTRAVTADQQRAADRAAFMLALTKFSRLGLQLIVLAVGAWQAVHQEMTAGAMIAASIIMSRALSPIEQAVGTWKQVVSARDAFNRLRAFFSDPPRRLDAMPLPPPAGRLDIEGVSQVLPGSEKPVLRNISFRMPAGTSVAIVGPSGAGKSTLARLIVGVAKPAAGAVRLDGADIFAANREQIGPHLGYLPQDVELFGGSVRQNIARMAEGDPEAVVGAARLAGVHELILRLPNGYDTEIGEAGARLSAGQRQRVAFARALYGAPRLVVLDEPNSNLDTEGEIALVQALSTLKQNGVTVILITHRPNLIAGVDKVLVLREGTIQKFGDREEIMADIVPRLAPRPAELRGTGTT